MAAASRGTRALAVLGRCVRAPFRALVRARDLYVSRMAACAGGGGRGAGLGPVGLVAAPRCQSHGFYRSGAGADDDVRELIRAASRAGRPPGVGVGVGPRSQSVAVARIDEDRACEFGLGDGERAQALEPRSKSCAASSKYLYGSAINRFRLYRRVCVRTALNRLGTAHLFVSTEVLSYFLLFSTNRDR